MNFPDWSKLPGIAVANTREQYGVIKFQLPFALTSWTLRVLLLWTLFKVYGW